MNKISGYHAHIYYDAETMTEAVKLCEKAASHLKVQMGRTHKKPVGPHPIWSCQLAFDPSEFGDVVPWLSLNRNSLTILVHPDTSNDFVDHTEHAMWMGKILDLDLSIFDKNES